MKITIKNKKILQIFLEQFEVECFKRNVTMPVIVDKYNFNIYINNDGIRLALKAAADATWLQQHFSDEHFIEDNEVLKDIKFL